MKERISEMLGNGIPQAAVALACGVDPSYVSQLMADEDFAAEVASKKVALLEQSGKSDGMMNDLEEESLEKLKNLMPFIQRPMDALRVFQVVNAAKRKLPEVTGVQQAATAPVVQLTVPVQVAVQFKMSGDQQVVEIDGRSMSSLPNRKLTEKLEERKRNRPALIDVQSASEIILNVERGLPIPSIANVL